MNDERKYVFIAGGIGITPFRSMIKELLATRTKKDIVLLYQARTADEFLFRDVFAQAEKAFGLHVQYLEGNRSLITKRYLEKAVPDYNDRFFYLSGPQGFVETVRQLLMEFPISEDRIKTDLFSGYE